MKNVKLMKSIKLIIGLLFITVIFSLMDVKGANDMEYVELYDITGEHIANAIVNKYSITKRVFDYDTSTFECVLSSDLNDNDINDTKFFVFKDGKGTYIYSGLTKNITYDEETNYVKFKGDDLRQIYNTEILLDFTDLAFRTDEDRFQLSKMFGYVNEEVRLQTSTQVDITYIVPTDTTDVTWMGNYDGTYLTVNANGFLKGYLGYYNYYIEARYYAEYKEIYFTFTKSNTTNEEIKLEDFVFDRTTTEAKTNHTTAYLKFNPIEDSVNMIWAYSSEETYNNTPSDQKEEFTFNVIDPFAIDLDTYAVPPQTPVSYVFKNNLCYSSNPGVVVRVMYIQTVNEYSERPDDITSRDYYLGKDNLIYEGSITPSNSIYPTITKIYEDEQFNKAQYEALLELINQRYIEYIILTDVADYGPVDIKDFVLYDFIDVYDSDGNMKTLPVSEITITQDSYKIKLGFKKTLLTEIIKGGN